MKVCDAEYYIIEKITCWTDDEENKRKELIDLLDELSKYKQMWWAFYDKHEDECYDVPRSMSETREKYFSEEEEEI